MYKVKDHLKPSNLAGISQEQLDDHWKLYEGYVKQVNSLCEKKNDPSIRHRYGFEYNGMVLHEYYFENLTGNVGELSQGTFREELTKAWGSFEAWREDFATTGMSRGIGWAILYADKETKCLTNHFIISHEYGHIAGFQPILVMDVWEHAYMVDHKAGGRKVYIEAFMKNVHWELIEKRYNAL